jgi:hypothetical protein
MAFRTLSTLPPPPESKPQEPLKVHIQSLQDTYVPRITDSKLTRFTQRPVVSAIVEVLEFLVEVGKLLAVTFIMVVFLMYFPLLFILALLLFAVY